MKPFLSLLAVGAFACFLMGLIWLSLKTFESPPEPAHQSWTHPLRELKAWDLIRPTRCQNAQQLKLEIQSHSEQKNLIWFVDVQPQKGKWVVFCSQASTALLQQRWQSGALIADSGLFQMKDQFVIFNVHASQAEEAQSFVQWLRAYESSKSLGVISPSRKTIESIRKARPQWFFGADRTTWTKVLAFRSLDLTGLVDFWADFYIFTKLDQDLFQQMDSNPLVERLLKQGKVLIKEESKEQRPEQVFSGVLPVTL